GDTQRDTRGELAMGTARPVDEVLRVHATPPPRFGRILLRSRARRRRSGRRPASRRLMAAEVAVLAWEDLPVEHLAHDPATLDLEVAPAVVRQSGLRLLRQPPEETLFAFLCTAANNVPRITRGIGVLAAELGAPIAELGGRAYHAFPTAEAIAGADVPALRER